MKLLLLISLVIFAKGSPDLEAQVRLIAHPGVPISQISASDLKGVFLVTKTSLPDGSRVEPVLLRLGRTLDDFAKAYVGKTANGLENYYRSLVFSGKGTMPRILRSDAEVLDYVRRTRGAIGYVSAEANIEGVKLLEIR
jgi:hypothetical protein